MARDLKYFEILQSLHGHSVVGLSVKPLKHTDISWVAVIHLSFRLIQVDGHHDRVLLLCALHSDVEIVAHLRVVDVHLQLVTLHPSAQMLQLLGQLLSTGGLGHVSHLDVSVHVATVHEVSPADNACKAILSRCVGGGDGLRVWFESFYETG